MAHRPGSGQGCAPNAPRPWWQADRRLPVVKTVIGVAGGIGLAERLGHRPLARRTVNGEGHPSAPVLAAEVDEQGVGVMLHAEAMPRVRLLVQAPHNVPLCGVLGDERRPPPSPRVGPSELPAGG